MDATTRFLIEAACVSGFVITLAVAGVRVQPRLLLAVRYEDARAERYPDLTLPKPELTAFILRPMLALIAIGFPAIALYVLLRQSGGWPQPIVGAVALGVWPLLAGAVALWSSRSPWQPVRDVLARGLEMPPDRRDEVLPAAFERDPGIVAALSAKDG